MLLLKKKNERELYDYASDVSKKKNDVATSTSIAKYNKPGISSQYIETFMNKKMTRKSSNI